MAHESFDNSDTCTGCQDESWRAFGAGHEKVQFGACDALVVAAAARNHTATNCLFECLWPWLMRWGERGYGLVRESAEDYAQDALIRLLGKINRRDSPLRPEGFAKFLGYAHLTLRSVTFNGERRVRDATPLDPETYGSGESDLALDFERQQQLLLAIEIFSSMQDRLERDAVRLRFYEGLSVDQIAIVLRQKAPGLELDKGAVYRILESALRKLRGHPLISKVRAEGS